MPRYVILEHDHPTLHWDLMLETGATLRTWRLSNLPTSEHSIDATALPDHRSFYLDYEGPLSGDRGAVVRWDAGTYSCEQDAPDEILVHLEGKRLRGLASLHNVAGSLWQFIFTAGDSR